MRISGIYRAKYKQNAEFLKYRFPKIWIKSKRKSAPTPYHSRMKLFFSIAANALILFLIAYFVPEVVAVGGWKLYLV